MRRILPNSIFILAQNSQKPIYAVGGIVRDFLLGATSFNQNLDFDICRRTNLFFLRNRSISS